MNLLNAALYDPSTAVVNKATTAALALTAFDTTNLRLTVTAPPSGRLWIVIICTIHGATTCPQIILGCLEGSTVRGRVTPEITVSNLAATSLYRARAEYCLTGLTPGQSYVLDAAYGVETVVASTNIKYGGPNNTTANDNFGAFQFEIWDPSPAYTPAANGVPPTSTVHVKLDTIDDFVDTEVGALATAVAAVQSDTDNIQTRLPAALVGGRMDSSVGAMAADVITAAALAADAGTEIGTAVWATATRALTDKSGFALTQSFPANFASQSITAGGLVDVTQAAADKVWGTAARLLTAGTNIVLAKGTGVTGFTDLSAAQVNTECDAALLDVGLTAVVTGRVDAAVSTRLASADYTAPDNAGITVAALAAAAAASDAAAIKTKTDSLTFTVPGKLDVSLYVVNGVTVVGAGTEADPWKGAE